jgi:hypothetical protein
MLSERKYLKEGLPVSENLQEDGTKGSRSLLMGHGSEGSKEGGRSGLARSDSID